MRLQIGIEGRTYEVDVEVLQEDGASRPPPGFVPYPAMPATIQSTAARDIPPQRAESNADVDEARVCRSPVAGIVIRVNIQPRQQLQANDLMFVLEAMKMETNVTAPGPGTVEAIMIQPQDSVKVNQVLVKFE